MDLDPRDVERILAAEHADPHTVLGAHLVGEGVVVRAFRPGRRSVHVEPDDPSLPAREAVLLHEGGLFEARFPEAKAIFRYRIDGERDPYAFLPTLGPLDAHLFHEGRHLQLYEVLGAHPRVLDADGGAGVAGVSFAVFAPEARAVRVSADFNLWDGRRHMLRRLSPHGIWELFVPDVPLGSVYKLEIVDARGRAHLKLDPFAFQCEVRPQNGGVVHGLPRAEFHDQAWLERRKATDPRRAPMSIYEVHLGGFARVPHERGVGAQNLPGGGHTGRFLTYREIEEKLVPYVKQMGFTHVELMPVTEFPYDGSWGYQVTGYFAATSRYGSPEDLQRLVDAFHREGIGVLLDWVPAHFPRDAHGLRRFDGSAVYEHLDPRQGEHPEWGTMVFNYGRPEVKNFLLASALFWLERFHFDGLRVDAVASMLYLDYGKGEGQWVPNRFGGHENLAAVDFLRALNDAVEERCPGAMVLAEESTAWPGVSRKTHLGGLGFSFKWNMGWMHDTLQYFAMDPLFRSHHHGKITFGLMYAWSESFVLPLSHDEVVHMKGSMIGKMPGDPFQRFANLRALYAWMWAHPGKKLLFMGGELAQEREFSEARSLDWHLEHEPAHAGVQALVRALNEAYVARPELWEADIDPAGFQWIDANDHGNSVASILRFDRRRTRYLVCVLNATPIPRRGYRIGVPVPGEYRVVLDTDDRRFGGSGQGCGALVADSLAHHAQPASLTLDLPPLATVWLEGPALPPPSPLEPPDAGHADPPDP